MRLGPLAPASSPVARRYCCDVRWPSSGIRCPRGVSRIEAGGSSFGSPKSSCGETSRISAIFADEREARVGGAVLDNVEEVPPDAGHRGEARLRGLFLEAKPLDVRSQRGGVGIAQLGVLRSSA